MHYSLCSTFIHGCVPKKASTISFLKDANAVSKPLSKRNKQLKRIQALENLSKLPEYASFERQISWACNYMRKDEKNNLSSFGELYREMVGRIYPTRHWMLV